MLCMLLYRPALEMDKMSLRIPNTYHQLPFSSHPQTQGSLCVLPCREWKRRKLKLKLKSVRTLSLTISCNLNFDFFNASPFENLFHTLISQFPSTNSLDLIAPALGVASGAAIYFSQLHKMSKFVNISNKKRNKLVGEWILFTSPTPFNRFVVLRCPSISFEGSEFLEDVNEKLVKEDRHFVRLNSGRIQVVEGEEEKGEEEEKLMYQRVCVRTEDGGVVSLDWPANLDLEEERGLDTTLLIVPGTAEGSMEKDIRVFVCECLRRGCFPVVMNPRGCAGSPITTARLFTAADSDAISAAIQFINKERPWTTLMGIGWGYGANMLTRYLAEVGEKTSLIAATCIDNPFDLNEATRSSPYHISLDKKLTSGLKDILRSNKELFQGRVKGFDVQNALLATSVRDFEKAISMVSYGYDNLEDFYSTASTRDVVGKVKIPLLFIQNDNGTVPLFSTPRSLIAENPFTSLLLCSYLPSSETASSKSTIAWCQHLTIEWLTAVELGLLKGRHPLLKDVDVTINPSKGLALVEGKASGEKGRVNRRLKVPNIAALDANSFKDLKEMFEEGDTMVNLHSRSRCESKGNLQNQTNGLQPQTNNSLVQQNSHVDAELGEDEGLNAIDSVRGEVLQTAKVVMNMLDVTMPDTLTEEQKKKVLTAVGQGETLMKALQDAVPEDVREKLTTAVSGILHSQESSLMFDRLLNLGRVPDVTSKLKSKVQEKTGGTLAMKVENEDPQLSAQMNRVDDSADGLNSSQTGKDKLSGGQESELQPSENLKISFDSNKAQAVAIHGSEIPDSDKRGTNDMGHDKENVDSPREKTVLDPDPGESRSETITKPELPSRSEGAGRAEERIADHYKEQDGEKNQMAVKEESTNQQSERKSAESSVDHTKTAPSTQAEDKQSIPVSSSSEIDLTGKDGDDVVKREERSLQAGSIQNGSKLPSFSVSQALDALTGIDDSTQVAVNSVFNVIEGMLTQLEEGRENENEDKGESSGYKTKDRDEVQDRELGFSENQFNDDGKLEKLGGKRNDKGMPSDSSEDICCSGELISEEKIARDFAVANTDDTTFSQSSDTASTTNEESRRKCHVAGRPSSEKSAEYLNHISHQVPRYSTRNLYRGPLYREYLRKYLISKMKTTKSRDLDTTTALFLDYFPEEGQWKLLEEAEEKNDIVNDTVTHVGVDNEVRTNLDSMAEDTDDIIEPSYVILDSEWQEEEVEKGGESDTFDSPVNIVEDKEDVPHLVKSIVLDTLKIEVGRRVSASDVEEMQPRLDEDLELIANAVCLSVGKREEHVLSTKAKDQELEKFGTLEDKHLIRAISSAFQETSYLIRVLPLGVVVGSCLASLRKYFDVVAINSNGQSEDQLFDQVSKFRDINHSQLTVEKADKMLSEKMDVKSGLDNSVDKNSKKAKSISSNGSAVMVGAVTAALGASALFVEQQNAETIGNLSKPVKEKEGHFKDPRSEEEGSEKNHDNIVTSLAEKAMSVAAPVVPTKEDGEVDHERLVSMLAELGQRGGMLKLVSKIALLWGGIRGAMSLTDKLISFLRMAEQPLFQRILGFVCMVLVLWSPVVIPLFPTLVQSWATHNSSKIAELACIIGLYVSIMLMVTLWGKRIRGYDNPLEQYGLDIYSPLKVQNFLKGLIGGVLLVMLIHSTNFCCGFVQPSCPAYPSLPSSDVVKWLRLSGAVLVLVTQGLATATGVAVVEELFFRSWLPDEIAADLGYYRGIIISGLAFSLSQRSPGAIPGLWLLSLALAGARQRSQESLSLPIGLRAGILMCSFILQKGGFLTYQSNCPIWLCGSHPFQPFGGMVGVAFALSLAMMLYPMQPTHTKEVNRIIRE